MKKYIKLVITMLAITAGIILCGCQPADTAEPGDAGSGLASVPMQTLVTSEYAKDYEEVNGYSAWVSTERDASFEVEASTLYLYDGIDASVIYTIDDGRWIDDNVLTDGEKLYFAVVHEEFIDNYTDLECNAAVFTYNLQSGECTELAKIDKMSGFAGLHGDTLYMNQSVFKPAGSGKKTSLCAYDLKTGETATIKEDFIAESQYGDYILGTGPRHDSNVPYTAVHLETLEMKELPKAYSMIPVEDGALYYVEGNNAIEKCDYDGNGTETFQLDNLRELLYLGKNTAGFRAKDGKLMIYSFLSGESEPCDEETTVVGSWTNPSSASMADMIDLELREDMTVTCYLQRQEYHGTYTVEGENISASFTEGKAYSSWDAAWHDVEDVQLRIEGEISGDRLNLTIHESPTYSWEASLAHQ